MPKKAGIVILFFFLFFYGFYSCMNYNSSSKNEKKVASVFDHDLFINELPIEFHKNTSTSDSIALVNAFVDQWVRKMLLLHEAEKRIPKTLDIDKLVTDYKQSLLINNLEKRVISEELDTIVSKQELENIYEKIKDHYIQEYPIIRLSYVKIHEKTSNIDKFYEWWKKNEPVKINRFCTQYAETCFAFEDEWIEWNEIKQKIDEEVIKKYPFNKKNKIQKNIGEYEYFIKIIDFVDKNEITPLSYIEDQVRNIIIQKRKSIVMDGYIEKLYLSELKKNNIVLLNNKN